MPKHELKSWPEFFEPIAQGAKSFDLRFNDRNFNIGDIVHYREWEPTSKEYTGRVYTSRVAYILDGIGGGGCVEPMRGLMRGFCILGLEDVSTDTLKHRILDLEKAVLLLFQKSIGSPQEASIENRLSHPQKLKITQ
jgi:hypothetical protein